MPTYATTKRFDRDSRSLARQQREAFRAALADFIADLKSGEERGKGPRFRRGLRVKDIEGAKGIFEMTWAPDGRATFQYGASLREGQAHVIWRRVGTHDVFRRP